MFHIVNTLEFKSQWTYLNLWFADFKMDVHVLSMKKTSGKSVYETLWKLRKVVTSWLALPQWHGVCDEAWQVLSLPENMREPHPTHRSWKTSVLMYMVKLRWINMGYRHPTSIFIGFPWIPLWVYEPDRGWSHNPRDFGFDWSDHWLHSVSPQIGERLHCLETPVERQLIPLTNPWKSTVDYLQSETAASHTSNISIHFMILFHSIVNPEKIDK